MDYIIYQVHMVQILFLTINDIFPYNLFPSFQKRRIDVYLQIEFP